jgi:RNA polymerase sigma-70 factor (ECF subfamily)
MNEQTTSPTLLSRLKNTGDQEAWSLFESIYRPLIRKYCARRGIQENDVDDLAQEVLTAVSQAIPLFDYQPSRGRFRGWLGTITANKVKRFFRKSKTPGNDFLDEPNLETKTPTDPDSDWVSLFSERLLEVACDRVRDQVEPQTWQSFECLWNRQMSVAEVAQQLGISVATVYVHKSRVMKRLEATIIELSDDLPVAMPMHLQ